MKAILFINRRICSKQRFLFLIMAGIIFFGHNCPVNAGIIHIADIINRPIQITSRTEPVLDMAVSLDGRFIIYTSGDTKPTDLWLASADPDEIILPEKLAGGPSVKSSPAISADGRFIAYVDTNYDVKGDIYVIDREDDDAKPIRLTDRKTEDGGPCFSSDDRFLYFYQAVGNHPRHLSVLDLKKRTRPALSITTGRDAMFCAISPDNREIAFVSARNDTSGNIFILNTADDTIRQITGGPAIDIFPQWASDSRTLYFSRIGSDTNHDHKLTPEDHSVICRIRTDSPDSIPFPVTPLNQVSFKPFAANGRIYFLSNIGGVSNCWSVPEDGYIRLKNSSADQFSSAQKIANRIPYDPYVAQLAYIAVIENFQDDHAICAKAGIQVASIFNELNMTASARAAYQYIRGSYKEILPEAIFAEIRQIGIEFQTTADSPASLSKKQDLLKKSLDRLDQIASSYPGPVAAEAKLENTRILLKANESLDKISQAIDHLDTVLKNNSADDDQKARALFLKAQIYGKTATHEKEKETLRLILLKFPEQRNWVDKAVNQIINNILTDFASHGMDEKIKRLNLMAVENKDSAPPLAMGALNRIGDLYYNAGQVVLAKTAYQNVIDTFPVLTTQTAAARLSLAEILFHEEYFRQAIDLYETEISLRESPDRIYQLARQGYIRKKISSGEFLFRLGEIPSAKKTFKELMDYDNRIIEAHRGYIKCAAASGDIAKVLDKYRKNLKSAPNDPVWLYCTGLCMTYLNNEDSAKDAKKLIQKSIRFNGSVEYFHQTLGYVYEVLETVYGKSRQLERALMSYQKAYFINDHVHNAENAANLELNLGNIYYLMGQYGKAFEFYSRRQNRHIKFSDPNTHIVFLKRYGESAFQDNDIKTAISAFQQAISLVDSHIDFHAPSRAFDRLNQYMKDRIIDPATNISATKKTADEVAKNQSEQNLKVTGITEKTASPPSSQWQSYKDKMRLLIDHQKTVTKSAVKLAKTYNSVIAEIPGHRPIENPDGNLSNLTSRIREALDFPERLIELKAEITDHLGLAYQENNDWDNAAETFQKVFIINKKMGNNVNLARNMRSVAYNTYQLAQSTTGDQHVKLLKKASADFYQALSLIDQYGVPEPKKREKQALIDISISTSLDAASATRAAKGFSASQEKRLAQSFISRIELELGHLTASQKELDKQLKDYPDPATVHKKDRYGVSLLYHRAALLDNAKENFQAAFEKFAASAELCLKMESPVSAATNIKNMASVGLALLKNATKSSLSEIQMDRLQKLDTQTEKLLKKKTGVTGATLLMEYHNILGVFYVNAAKHFRNTPPTSTSDSSEAAIDTSARAMALFQQTVSHFTRGLTLFEENKLRATRKQMETGSFLYLNMACVARELGDEKYAVQNYQSALANSEIGVFPDLEWRALLGLGQVKKALEVLKTVPIIRAGCQPMEIRQAFGSLVFTQLENKKTDAALTLVETISELERFNRMAPYVRPKTRKEKAFFLKLYPRLENIRQLRKEVAAADKDHQPFLEKRLRDEQKLLIDQMGGKNENLPAPFSDIQNKKTQDLAVRLMSMGEKIEEIAESLTDVNVKLLNKKTDTEKNQALSLTLKKAYHSLVKRYQTLAEDAFYARKISSPSDFITLMSAEPFESMDLTEILSDDDAVARLFHSGIKDSPYALFLITQDETTAFIEDNKDTLRQKIDDTIDWITPYIVYEDPVALDFGPSYPYALSAKHLARCINNRKPFKQKLMAVPRFSFPDTVSKHYDIQSFRPTAETGNNNFKNKFSSTNTLLIANGPKAASTVPTEPEDMARHFFAVYTDDDTRIRLEKILSRSSALSLSILSGNFTNNLYLIGHLFSIYGCPGIIFVSDMDNRQELVSRILGSYSKKSGIEALISGISVLSPKQDISSQAIQPAEVKTDRLIYLGYQGMTKKESAAFAKKNFITYVKTGKSDFDRKDYAAATVMFENAIAIANEIAKYDRYLPDLYKYARESAYRAGNNKAALIFAKDLADLFEDSQPDSKVHAEALLRLGLMYSKKEDYENAIPIIKRAVHIMSQLTPDKDMINAFMDLGIVLENATNYETALSRFKTAADLSRTLNRSDLLGEQYMNIGRIYDLRLNQYATAILNYKKALKIYTSSDDIEKISESNLDIGRCYRLLGNFSEADRYYGQSLTLIESNAPAQQLIKAKILIEQADNEWFQGRYEEAFRLQRQCYNISRENNFPLLQVISLNTEGLIWWTLGEYDKALEALNNALTAAKNLKIRQDEVASTLNNMGLIYRDKGNYEKALETFDQAIVIDTSIGSKWGQAYDYRNKGLTFLKLDQPETAAALFDRAYTISTAIGNRINAAKAILGKGDALYALKDYTEARTAYQTALTLSESMLIRETQWRSLFGLAKIRINFDKKPDAAEKLLRKSVDVIEQLRSDIKVKQLKENFISNKLSVYETLIKLLADKNQPKQAFEMAERSRARNFIDLLGGQQIGFADETDNKLYKKQQIIKSEIKTTESLLAISSKSSEREIYKKSIKNLQHDLQNIIIEMQLKNPQLASMVSVPQVNTEKLLTYLEPGTALISYYLLEKEVFCWILRADIKNPENRLQLVRIPADRRDLEKKILEYRRIIQNLEPYEKHSESLYAQLFKPVQKYLKGVHTLGICPHSSLHYLSFATLFNGKSFLLDHFSLFYVPSAAVLEYTLSRRMMRPYRSPKVLAIGNPDLGDPILDLPFAEQEVGAIKWDFPDVTILTRDKATKDWVVKNVSDFDIIHIASHGEFNPVNPLLSAIKLAVPKDKDFTKSDIDGNLDAGEIFSLKINADMVFLSACQTGLGKINAGDDVVGLNRAFFFAGTHTVISSLWRVSDVSTAVMIKTFYRLYMNQNKADCLQQAALHVKTRYPHPGYWGAFTLVGDYY